MLFELILLLVLLGLVLGGLLSANWGIKAPLTLVLAGGGQLVLQRKLASWQQVMTDFAELCATGCITLDFGPCFFLLQNPQGGKALLAISQREQRLYLQLLAAGWGSQRGHWLKIRSYAQAVMLNLPLAEPPKASCLVQLELEMQQLLAGVQLQAVPLRFGLSE